MNIRSEKQGSVTTVIIDRPQAMNAIDRAAALALADAFRAFDADPQARVAVLCGEGGTFCAGADLKAFLANPDEWQVPEDGDAPLGPTRMLLGKPVIAAVSGHAVAGGLELALWADLRVVEESAVFGVFCRRWGVPLIDGGTVRLARLIGHSRALDMLLTWRPLKSAEAPAFRPANRVVPDGTARLAAEALAAEIAAFPQTGLRHDRLSSYEQWGMSLPDALTNESRHGAISLASGDALAGAAQFKGGKGRHGTS